MQPDKIKEFVKTTPPDFVERCVTHATAFQEMVSSPSYALLVDMWEILETSYAQNAAYSVDLVDREENHYNLMALRRVRATPLTLQATIKELVSATPSDEGNPPE